jgi:hypothetical protein
VIAARAGRLGIVAAALCALASPGQAQRIRASQEAWVRQRLADTWIELHYRRPVARGRALFGNVVAWGRIWTPGADTATTISVSTPVRVEGQTLPAGTYSVWMVPDSSGPWTVIFSRAQPVFHVPYPGEGQDQLRVRAAAWQGPHMETLLWYFPDVDGPAGTLVMHWGTTGVPLHIRVD